MAIDDVSFNNLRGEVISRSNLVQQMIQYYELKIQNGETNITDFNEGSEIRNFLETFAVDIYYLMEMENDILKECFPDTAEGIWLDKIGMHPFVKLERDTGSVARGDVTFSILEAVDYAIVIPNGTILIGDNNLYYSTESEANIEAGETSITVPAVCITTGTDGNCDSGTITKIDESYFNDNRVSVTNNLAFTDGTNYEEDDDYRERILNFIRADDFGSLLYYQNLCNQVEGVHDALLIDDENYTGKMLINGDVKPTPDSVLLDVLVELSDIGKKVLKHTFIVDKPVYDEVDLDISITVVNEMDLTTIENIMQDFFDGGDTVRGFEYTGLNISESVTSETLYGIFGLFENILETEITSDGEPVTEINCPVNHVLKLGTLNVTQTIVE